MGGPLVHGAGSWVIHGPTVHVLYKSLREVSASKDLPAVRIYSIININFKATLTYCSTVL